MLYGNEDWRRLADAVTKEDREAVMHHNRTAAVAYRLDTSCGPVPCIGAVTTAPVVILLTHPVLDAESSAIDYSFCRPGWPLSALHPDAPAWLRGWWEARLSELVERFGAQHVSNAVAAVFLRPWPGEAFIAEPRLPSRSRMLGVAAAAAERDAILLMLRGAELWTEHADIAALPPTRLFAPRSWRAADVNATNLGDQAFDEVCKRIEVHAWL
jgi:hypothetical protein